MATKSALQPVQAQVYAVLNNDPQLSAVAPVYDAVPDSASYPYLTLGEFVEERSDTLGEAGRSVQVTLYAYSQASGYMELQTILDHLIRLLDDQELPNAAGWATWSNDYDVGQLSREDDGITRQLIARFRVEVQQTDGA